MAKGNSQKQTSGGSALDFEATLWAAADKLRANPPFNMSDWGGENLRQDVRWKFGMPPVNNANYAWIQHFIHQLSPVGVAGFVLPNGSMSTNHSGRGDMLCVCC